MELKRLCESYKVYLGCISQTREKKEERIHGMVYVVVILLLTKYLIFSPWAQGTAWPPCGWVAPEF